MAARAKAGAKCAALQAHEVEAPWAGVTMTERPPHAPQDRVRHTRPRAARYWLSVRHRATMRRRSFFRKCWRGHGESV